jgi:hypothetical protein
MNTSAGSRVRQGLDWVEAAAEMAASGVGMLRRLAEAVGTLTVVAGVALVMVPSFRESAVQIVRDAFASDNGAADVESGSTAAAMPSAGGREARLAPAEIAVAQYLSRRYRVADEAVRPLVVAAREAGRETELDPHLILAVMAVESSMNPFAESPVGAQGLMQVMTSVHGERRGQGEDSASPLEPSVNIRMGSAILSDLVRRGGSLERGLRLYVAAVIGTDDGGYASRVLAEMGRLKTAASGDVAGALAAGLRADTKGAVGTTATSTPAPGAVRPPVVAASDS